MEYARLDEPVGCERSGDFAQFLNRQSDVKGEIIVSIAGNIHE